MRPRCRRRARATAVALRRRSAGAIRGLEPVAEHGENPGRHEEAWVGARERPGRLGEVAAGQDGNGERECSRSGGEYEPAASRSRDAHGATESEHGGRSAPQIGRNPPGEPVRALPEPHLCERGAGLVEPAVYRVEHVQDDSVRVLLEPDVDLSCSPRSETGPEPNSRVSRSASAVALSTLGTTIRISISSPPQVALLLDMGLRRVEPVRPGC